MATDTLEVPATEVAPVIPAAEPQLGMDKIRAEIAKKNTPATSTVTANIPKVEKVAPAGKAVPLPTSAPSTAPEAQPALTQDEGPLSDEAKEYVKGATKPSADRFMVVARKEAAKLAEKMVAEKLASQPKIDPSIEEKATKASARAAELEAELRQVAIERSPEFKEKFIERPKAIRSQLSEIAKTYEISPDELISTVEGGKESRRRLNELIETVGTVDRVEAAQLARELVSIQDDRTKVLSDHETALRLLEGRKTEQTKAFVQKLLAERADALKSRVLPEIEKTYSVLFEGDEGQKLKSTVVGAIEKLNASDLERMNAPERAAMISCAFMAQPQAELIKRQATRISELESQLTAVDEVNPSLGGPSKDTVQEEKPMSFLEKLRAGKLD